MTDLITSPVAALQTLFARVCRVIKDSQATKACGFMLAILFSTTAVPALAGPIVIEFAADVTTLNGALGPQGSEVRGVISFELPDLADSDSDSQRAVFNDGQRAQRDLGWVGTFSVALTTASGREFETLGGSAMLAITNTDAGDQLLISTRSFTAGNQRFGNLFDLTLDGSAELFAGTAPVPDNLANLGDFLLSFDSGEITAAQATTRFSVPDFLALTSISIQSVPEPATIGLFVLGLGLLRSRRSKKTN